MKKLNFERILYSDEELSRDCVKFFRSFIDQYSKNFFNFQVELYSDRGVNEMSKPISHNKDIDIDIPYDNIKHFSNFIIYYIFNILLNNNAVITRKYPPYDINIVQKLSFREKKYQMYLFLDDRIFGICVGTKFKNILSLIQSIFPLIAKTDFLNEIRFFPISRMDYILNE
jgi:hypothetical protein